MVELRCVGHALLNHPRAQVANGIALYLPALFFVFCTVVLAVNVAHVMPVIAVGIAKQERRTMSLSCPVDESGCGHMDCPHVLPIHVRRLQAECCGASLDVASRRLREMGVLVVHIVFTHVDDRQLEQLRQVHYFVQHALPERAFTEKARRNPTVAQALRGESCARRDSYTAGDDRVGTEVTSVGISNVHRSAFAAAIPSFLTQQFSKHPLRRGSFGEAMSVATMRAGDVVILPQRFANPHRHRFFADVQVSQSWHQSARIQLVHLLFERANAHHLTVHGQIALDGYARSLRSFRG